MSSSKGLLKSRLFTRAGRLTGALIKHFVNKSQTCRCYFYEISLYLLYIRKYSGKAAVWPVFPALIPAFALFFAAGLFTLYNSA